MLDRVQAGEPPREVTRPTRPGNRPGGGEFARALAAREAGLKFSAHAQARLAALASPLEGRDLARIEAAVTQAAQRGAKESLILYDDLALVVSVRNRTVITAVDAARRRENVFTNVDSVVIVEGGAEAGRSLAHKA